jgi:hypothetical protein
MSRILIPALESDVRAFTLEVIDWPPDRQGFTHYALKWEGWRHDLGEKGPRAQHFHAPIVDRVRSILKEGYHVAVDPNHPNARIAHEVVKEARR